MDASLYQLLYERLLDDPIHGKLGDPNEWRICCPFCIHRGHSEDTEYKCHINTEKLFYHCFRCEIKGRLNKEYQEITSCLRKPQSLGDLRLKAETLFHKEITIDYQLDISQFSMELDEKTTPYAFKYLIDRNMTIDEIKKYKICVGKSYTNEEGELITMWGGRVIFPFVEDGVPIYAIGRAYTGKKPKYLNSEGSKSNIVYGIDDVKGVCILCEGVISAIAASRVTGIPAIATLGKSISEIQVAKIRACCKNICLSYDGGVPEKEIRTNLRILLNENFENIWNVTLPKGTDPDDLGLSYLEYYKQAQKINSFRF